jgi:hypothetical protein
MSSKLYIIMRKDLFDNSPGKMMAQSAHAQAEFDAYINAQANVSDNETFWQAISTWREQREFGTTLVLHEPGATMNKISMNVTHWGFVTDPTYPYRNYYGEVFTRSEITCMWVFAYNEDELEYMRQFSLHK